MTLTINTNLASMLVQQNLSSASEMLNGAIERMTTGYKINHARDNAAGHSISTDWTTKLGSIDVASQNAAMGMDMLTTMEGNIELIINHIQRIRDLTEQAANGTYATASRNAIKSEMDARISEITRISSLAEYNGINLFETKAADVVLQVGIKGTTNDKITIAKELFGGVTVSSLLGANFSTTASSATASTKLDQLDTALLTLSGKLTSIGSIQNSIESAISTLSVQSQNVTSSLSTIKDSDVASESSAYIKAQILQQASATLLSTANQTPSIALNLI